MITRLSHPVVITRRTRACPAIVGPGRCAVSHRQVHHPLGCHRPRIPDRIIFDKLVQVLVFGCGYRRIADGRPSLRRKPHAGDRLPVARVARDGQACWLGEALATPAFPRCCAAALATGTPGSLPRWADPTPARWAVHRLTGEAVSGACRTSTGSLRAAKV